MGEDKGYKFVDKRRIFKEDNPSTQQTQDAQKTQETQQTQATQPLPPVNFATFIVSLSSSALVHLGEIPDPTTGQYNKNLTLAKQTIDILEMLKEKTKGNLDPDEEGLLTNIIFDLRVRYVKQVQK